MNALQAAMCTEFGGIRAVAGRPSDAMFYRHTTRAQCLQ